jgi:protein transport protein SEC24
LVRPLGLEAVLRVRASQGIRISDFYGNFFARSPDLLSLPNLTADHSYTVQLNIDEALTLSNVCFQTAILHTTHYGMHTFKFDHENYTLFSWPHCRCYVQ